jgi:hypothetical protein
MAFGMWAVSSPHRGRVVPVHGRHALQLVLLRFPEHKAHVCGLALRDTDFRELCENYGLARRALERFEADGAHPPRPEIAEYRVLIRDLEHEILVALDDVADDGSADPFPEKRP